MGSNCVVHFTTRYLRFVVGRRDEYSQEPQDIFQVAAALAESGQLAPYELAQHYAVCGER